MSQLPDQRTSAPFYAWVYLLIIAITTAFVFGQLVGADFLGWDELFNIWKNPDLNPATLHGLWNYWKEPAYGLYIPLTYTVWWLLTFIARVSPDPRGATLNPSIYHLTNIAFHIISAVAVYFILLRLLRKNNRAACFGAMLFAIHPVQVEPVAWTAGLKDVMSGMFSLIAIWQYIAAALEDRGKGMRYAAATVALVLAMLSKPAAMMTPAIAVAIDWLLLRRPWKQIGLWITPWMSLAILCAIVAKLDQPAIGVEGALVRYRSLVAADALTFYLGKLIWPIHLAPDYGYRPAAIMHHWWFYVSWIIPTAIALILVFHRKRSPQLQTAALIFLLAPLPVLGLVTFLFQHFSTTADHYLYLAMLGPALAIAWLILRFPQPAVTWVVSLWLSLLGIRSFLQTRYWQNDSALWTHTIDVNPHSFMAMSNFGVYLLDLRDYDDAERYLKNAVDEYANYVQAYENLAFLYEQEQKWELAVKARQDGLRAQLARHPKEAIGDLVPPLYKLAFDQIQLGHFTQAKACLEQARKFDPNRPELLQMDAYFNAEMKKKAATTEASYQRP